MAEIKFTPVKCTHSGRFIILTETSETKLTLAMPSKDCATFVSAAFQLRLEGNHP